MSGSDNGHLVLLLILVLCLRKLYHLVWCMHQVLVVIFFQIKEIQSYSFIKWLLFFCFFVSLFLLSCGCRCEILSKYSLNLVRVSNQMSEEIIQKLTYVINFSNTEQFSFFPPFILFNSLCQTQFDFSVPFYPVFKLKLSLVLKWIGWVFFSYTLPEKFCVL